MHLHVSTEKVSHRVDKHEQLGNFPYAAMLHYPAVAAYLAACGISQDACMHEDLE
jgi:hypothetical protein